MNFDNKAPNWNDQNMWDRFHHSISLLYCHGFMTKAEVMKIRGRIYKESKSNPSRDTGVEK